MRECLLRVVAGATESVQNAMSKSSREKKTFRKKPKKNKILEKSTTSQKASESAAKSPLMGMSAWKLPTGKQNGKDLALGVALEDVP